MRAVAPYILVILAGLTVSSLLTPPRQTDDAASVARDTGVRALGAARGYASTALWLRAGEAYKRGDLYETLTIYQLIRELQPRNPAVYSYLAWNQAYNIAPLFAEPAQRADWVARGLETLRQGQRALPDDASLLMDEWHFVLNRAVGLPAQVLQSELAAWRDDDPAWAVIVEGAQELHAGLDADDQSELARFLDEVGLLTSLVEAWEIAQSLPQPQRELLLSPRFDALSPVDKAAVFAPLFPDDAQAREAYAALFDGATRRAAGEFAKLSGELRRVLMLWDWCRFHLLTLILQPAQQIRHRSITVDWGLLNSYRLAIRSCPPEALDVEFASRYRRGVATAFANGIENAARFGGEEAQAEFAAHMRGNFSRLPGWLPD